MSSVILSHASVDGLTRDQAELCELCDGLTLKASELESFTGGYLRVRARHYSASDFVDELIDKAMSIKRNRSIGKCFRYVKRALLESGLVDYYLPGISAQRAGEELRKHGFINLLVIKEFKSWLTDPYQAPKGAVLVYRGGRYGHIEIKTAPRGQGGFVSDYFNVMARTGTAENGLRGLGRKLVGVYIRPDIPDEFILPERLN